jgi:hypothetical protein
MLLAISVTSLIFGRFLIKIGAAKIDRAMIYSTLGTIAGVWSYISFDLDARKIEIVELIFLSLSMMILCLVITISLILFRSKIPSPRKLISQSTQNPTKTNVNVDLKPLLSVEYPNKNFVSRLKKLNFKYRLLILLSAIYMISALIFGINSYQESSVSGDYDFVITFQFTIFTPISSSVRAEAIERCINSDESEWLVLSDKKIEPTSDWCDFILRNTKYKKSPNYIGFAITLFIFPALFMLIAWLVIKVAKWLIFGSQRK